jgi:hypothetical protein
MFFQLRRQINASAALGTGRSEGLRRVRRVVIYMVAYPIAYFILSFPLAIGRMISAAGHDPSLAYFCLAGAMMTSSGLVDSLLYTLTRRNLLIDTELSNVNDQRSPSYPTRAGFSLGQNSHLKTTVSANPYRGSMVRGSSNKESSYYGSRSGSTEQIVPSRRDMELSQMGKVYQSTTIEVTHESATYLDSQSDRSSDKG